MGKGNVKGGGEEEENIEGLRTRGRGGRRKGGGG